MSKNCVLFIDGENFLHKTEQILRSKRLYNNRTSLDSLDIGRLLLGPLTNFNITRKIFYAAKLHFNPETREKSRELIKFQRKLRNKLTNAGFKFIVAGNVRSQKINNKIIFREKGVDVRIGVDLVAMACDNKVQTAILCSSDSDLQPAITELKGRNVKIVYLGFKSFPNKGLIYTTDKTILLSNDDVIDSFQTK